MLIRLYDHQLDAVKKMKNGCILCGGVGSGKSLTSLAYYYLQNGGKYSSLAGESYISMKNPKDLYIITTARKRDTLEWNAELTRFLMYPNSEVSAYDNKIVIDSWNNIKKYTDVKGAFFIFDEQRVIGSGSWVKAFLKICKTNKWILLSATPGDSWQDYIPVFIANGFYKNRTEFSREHIVYNSFTKYPKIERYLGVPKLKKYRQQVLVTMDYVKHTVSEKRDIFSEYDQGLYRNTRRLRWDPYKDEPFQNASAMCYALRKIVNSSEDRQGKLLDLYERHSKLIVFYNFNYELDILRSLPYGKNVSIAEWNGHKHEPIPKTDKWVYLVQYTAGNEGWNCVETDTIVFYSQNYSYKVMVQAAGRIDRLNTPFQTLYYYYLKSKSDIDMAIARALKYKKNFNESGYSSW